MLKVYVDRQTISAPPATCDTLGDLVSWVTREHLHDGRIVQKLVVNGQNYYALNQDYLGFVMQDPDQFHQTRTVEITSTPAATLVWDSITGAVDYCESLLLGLQSIAQKLRAGQVQEGFHFYAAALKGLGAIMELMTSLERALNTDFTQITVSGQSVRASLDGIYSKVQALVEAQERNDLITMADLLEYDIHDTVGHWKLALHELARSVQNTPESGGRRPEAQSLASYKVL